MLVICEKMKKTYQNIIIKEKDVGFTIEKQDSKFCNEGKWNNFIEPLLPKDCADMTFVEFGCNAGMFLKLAKQFGFRNVVGVDKSRYTCEYAKKYMAESGFDYKIINNKVDDDFDYDKIPVADFTVMSNFHYYLTINTFMLLLDKMKFKTRYCIIVTADFDKGYNRAKADLDSIRYYFRDWKEIKSIMPISTKGDSFPRVMSSIMFESPLERVPIEPLYKKITTLRRVGNVVNFTKKIAQNDTVENLKDTDYYKVVESMHTRRPKSYIDDLVISRVKMLYDVKKNGIKHPIFINDDNRMVDGKHRMLFLKALGYKSIIARKI